MSQHTDTINQFFDDKDELDTPYVGLSNLAHNTIVQLNTGGLEAQLAKMDKRIKRNEDEIKHPVWMDDLMATVNQIPAAVRSIEHAQMVSTRL